MKIIGYHITNNLIANSEGEVYTQSPWLNFLFADKGECIKVLYHLDYSTACLLKMLKLSEDALRTLQETTDLKFEEYKFEYISKKWFAIKDFSTRQWAGFSDMSQYIPTPLESTGDDIADSIDHAIEAKIAGAKVYKVLTELGLHPKSLTSPISAFNREILSNIDLPTIDDLPDEVAELAYQCCKGSWIEAFQLGLFEDTLDFDIRSAYGSELAKLVDFRYGKWIPEEEYEQRLKVAKYGYCKGTVTIDKPFSPIMYKSNTQLYTPTGTWETVLTMNEIDFIYKWKLGTFEIENGWWWVPAKTEATETILSIVPDYIKNTVDYPLKNILNKLYQRKQQSANSFEDNILKRIIAGIWGKMLEYTERGLGELFNPVWGAEVETNIKLKVADFVLSNNLQDNLLSITVDGALIKNTDQPCFPPLKAMESGEFSIAEDNRAMGTWKLSHHCPSIIIGSGTQAIRNKQSDNMFSLQYDNLLEMIAESPKSKEYKLAGLSPVTLPKAIMQDRLEDLGKLEELTRNITLNSEVKRDYNNQPQNGKELLANQFSSKPWDISIVQEITED